MYSCAPGGFCVHLTKEGAHDPKRSVAPPPVTAGQQPRLLDQVAVARQRGASEPTTSQLVSWVRAYVLFHGKRHPRELDGRPWAGFWNTSSRPRSRHYPHWRPHALPWSCCMGPSWESTWVSCRVPNRHACWTRWLKSCEYGTSRRERRRAISTGSGSSSCSTASGTHA